MNCKEVARKNVLHIRRVSSPTQEQTAYACSVLAIYLMGQWFEPYVLLILPILRWLAVVGYKDGCQFLQSAVLKIFVITDFTK